MEGKNATLFRTILGLAIVATVAIGCYYVFSDSGTNQPYVPIPDNRDDERSENDIEMPPVNGDSATSIYHTSSAERQHYPGSNDSAARQSNGTADVPTKVILFPVFDETKAVKPVLPIPKKEDITVNVPSLPVITDKKTTEKPAVIVVPETIVEDEIVDTSKVDWDAMPSVHEICTYPLPALRASDPTASLQVHAPRGTFGEGCAVAGSTYTSEEEAWEVSEEHWWQSLDTLENTLECSQTLLNELQVLAATPRPNKNTLQTRLAKLKADVEVASTAEAVAQVRLATLQKTFGQGHVQRDEPQPSGAAFPNGESIIMEAKRDLLGFEAFVFDTVKFLSGNGDLGPDKGAAILFVHDLMRRVYESTLRYVQNEITAKQQRMSELYGAGGEITQHNNDCVAWQFHLYAQQPLLLAQVSALSDKEMEGIVLALDPSASKTSGAFEVAVRRNSPGPGLKVLQLVRLLLRLHTVALLSDPRCYLYPAPGERLPYKDGHCVEIGAKKYGRFKEGEVMEVVLCGLYFQDPATGAKPVIPILVRRLQ